MPTEKKIAVVIGDDTNFALCEALLRNTDDVQLTVFAIDRQGPYLPARSRVKVLLFPHLPEMKNYMRGLDDHLREFDAVVALDYANISSFQAHRIARAYEIPFFLMTSHASPFLFHDDPEINAIKYDLFQHAQGFIPLTSLSTNALEAENIPGEKIIRLGEFASALSEKNDKGRQKFRDYIGLKNELLFAVFLDQADPQQTEEILRAFALLKQPARLLLIGLNTEFATHLKNLCVSIGIAKTTLFLHQNFRPFYLDLLAAIDAIFDLSKKTAPLSYRTMLVEATRLGSVVISPTTSGLEELIPPGHFHGLMNFFARDILRVMQNFTAPDGENAPHQAPSIGALIASHVAESTVEPFAKSLEKTISAISEKKLDDAMILVEDLLLRKKITHHDRAVLYSLKGKLMTEKLDQKQAKEAYEKALVEDDSLVEPWLALADLAKNEKQYEAAAIYYRKLLAHVPGNEAGILGIGRLYIELDLIDNAVLWLSLSQHVESGSERIWSLLGQSLKRWTEMHRKDILIQRLTREFENEKHLLRHLT